MSLWNNSAIYCFKRSDTGGEGREEETALNRAAAEGAELQEKEEESPD